MLIPSAKRVTKTPKGPGIRTKELKRIRPELSCRCGGLSIRLDGTCFLSQVGDATDRGMKDARSSSWL